MHPDTLNSRGLPYDYLGKFDTDKNGVGGGDCDTAVGGLTTAGGDTNLAVSSLSLANLTTNQSADHGDTFHAVANSASVQNTGVDRQWNAADTGLGQVYMTVHDGANEIQVYSSIDGGYTYLQSGQAIDATHLVNAQQNNHFGGLVVNPVDHKLYLAYIAPSAAGNNLPENQVMLAVGDPCAVSCTPGTPAVTTWTDHVVFTGDPATGNFAHDFPGIAVDKAGRAYVSWTDTNHMFVAHESSPGSVDAWSAPVQADSTGEHSTMFPWMVGGADGNVDLVYYGSQLAPTAASCPTGASGTLGDGQGVNNNCFNQWSVRFSQSIDGGVTFGDSAASAINHLGSICDQGLACTVPTVIGDRSLLDFFQVDLDPLGGAVISYESDPTVANFTRQCTGVSATTGAAISRSCAALVAGASPPPAPQCSGAHVVTDPAGDAISPPGAPGDTSTADITDVSFANDNTAKTLTTTMTISNLQTPPMAGSTFTVYDVVWTAPDGKIYATSAAFPDPTGVFSYSYGTFDPTTNQIVTAGTGATGTSTTGTNGTISVTVPYSGVGSPVIPVQTDVNPAVKNPYALTIAGEGAAGSGLVFNKPADRGPNTGFGADWSVCGPAVNAAEFGAVGPAGGLALLTGGFLLVRIRRRRRSAP